MNENAVLASCSSVDRCCFLTVYENVDVVVCVVCELVVRGLAPGRHSDGCGSMLDQFDFSGNMRLVPRGGVTRRRRF